MAIHLADKSALEQRRRSADARELLRQLLFEGGLASCHVVALEVLYSARNLADYEALLADIGSLPWLDVTKQVMDRAMRVQHLLATTGRHRVPIPDLLIAATAEVHGATVLHYDHDFDVIGSVTGQRTRWVVPRGRGA
jgi:predicted nucleic acid-binding protein